MRVRIVLFCISLFCFLSAFSQDFKSEAELKKKAEELFDQQDYITANPLFSQLLSLYPKDPNYNFKFGVCLLYTTENKEKPLTYLEFASKKPETEKEVFFFLGRAYHLNYGFTDALNAYENFKKNGNPKTVKKYEVDQHILMCKNGISLLKNVKDLFVLEKKSMKEEDFFRAYNTESLKGKLIVKPEEFKTPADRKKKESSVMFVAQGSEEIFFSSFGQDEKNGKDIYSCKKLPSGEWGPPQSLGANINTPYDEDFPYLHADGKTLYFSSKGHNSMGGYDVFKTVYDSASKKWSAPINLDFAVSTPDDDIFFMPDSGQSYAYFASKRNSPAGRVDVYKLRIDLKPVELAIIKGKVTSEVGGQSLDAKITVKKAEGGEVIGEYTTNPKNGEYILSVPNGGRFLFEVGSPDFSTRSEIVVVPTQYELKALKQAIALKPSKLQISNFFDEVVSDEDSKAAAMAYLKEKAKLEVNFSDAKAAEQLKTTSEEIVSSNQPSTNTQNSNTGNAGNTGNETSAASQNQGKTDPKVSAKFSNQELVDIAKEDAVDSRKDAEELQDKSDNAAFASKKIEEEAQNKLTVANEIEASASSLTDPVKKEEELKKAAQLKKESELLNKEAAAVGTLAQSLYKESQDKFKEAKENEKYAEELDKAVKANSKESILKLTEQRSQLEADAAAEKDKDYGLQQMKAEAATKQQEANKAEKDLNDLKAALKDAEAEQNTIREQAAGTKNKKEKQALNQQADLLTPDIEEKRKQVETAEKKAEELESEAATANSQVEIFSKVLGGGSLGEIVASSSSNQNSTSENAPIVSENKTLAQTSIETVNKSFEDQLKSSLEKSEGTEKQKDLAKVYDTWAAGLQKETDKLKATLKDEKDPKKRSDLADAIMALETASAEKTAMASDARSKADELASAGSTSSSNATATNNVTTTTQENSGQTTVVLSSQEKVDQINSSYAKEISALDNVPDADRDKQKVAVLDNWVKSLNSQADEIKSKMTASSSDSEKKALESQLESVNKQITEKQAQASLAFAKAERAEKKGQEVSQIINTPSGKDSQYSVEYANQLKSADTIQNPSRKESEKARIYEAWVDDIKKEKTELESYLPKANDENLKKSLDEKIAKLTQFIDEQSALASSSRKSAESMAATTSNSGSQNQSISSNPTVSNTTSSNLPSEVVQLNTKFEEQLKTTDTISDPVRRNSEKAKMLEDWSSQLNATASSIRTGSASITDENLKKDELAKAEKIEAESADKRKMAEAFRTSNAGSIAQNSTSQESSTSSTNSQTETNPVALNQKPAPVDNDRYKQELTNVDSRTQSSDLEKADEKRKLYDSWSRDIEKEIAYLKKEKASSENKALKDSIDAKISILEKESLEKQAMASLQVAKADRLRKQQEQASNQTNAVAENSIPANPNTNQTTTTNTQGNETVGVVNVNTNTPQNNTVASSASPEVSKEVVAKLNESARLKFTADSLRQSIGTVSEQSKRAEILAKSLTLDKQSYVARTEASASMAAQTTNEFNKNAEVLSEYSGASSRNMSDEVTMANMLVTESEYYKKEAGTIRQTVAGTEANASTVSVLERAEEYEKLAVTKQQKAMELYLKGNPSLAQNASLTQNTNPLAVNPQNQTTSTVQENNQSQNNARQGQPSNNQVNANSQETVITTQQNNNTNPSGENQQATANNQTSGQSTNQGTTNQTNQINETSNTNVVASTSNPSDTSKQVNTRKYATVADSLNAGKINTEARRLETLASNEDQQVESLKLSARTEKMIADSLTSESVKPENAGTKASLVADAEKHSKLVKIYEGRADSIASIAANSRAAAKAKREEAELLAQAAPVKSETPSTNAGNTNQQNQSAQSSASGNNNSTNQNGAEIPTDYLTESNELKREIFIAYANKAAYSASKPIPINEKIPNGIIFKVQVGAFRNPIAPEVLKGFAPLMGETSPTGITRYTAGFFKVFENANNARKEINGMGYRDAFVVAFCNGRRIPVNEAQRLVKEGKTCSGEAVVSTNTSQPDVSPANNDTQSNQPVAVNQPVNRQSGQGSSEPAANVAVQQVKGLFYTVQVGVYSSKIPASKLNFVQPLFSEAIDNGLVRYSVGMYDNLDLAKKARQIVLGFGLSDAFITAYINGKRISVAEAGKLEAENGRSVFATDPLMNKMPESGNGNRVAMERTTQQAESNVMRQGVQTTSARVNESTSSETVTPAFRRTFATVIPMSDTGLVFRVQIGAFKDEVPVDIAGKFIRIADKGVNHYEADSLTIYTVGGSRDYETAVKLKEAVSAEGLTDAFIVAYRKNEKISVEEAIKQTNIKY